MGRSAVVCVVSEHRNNPKEEIYKDKDDKEYAGTWTNDAPVKALVREAWEQGKRAETVFCLTSNEAIDAYDDLEATIGAYVTDKNGPIAEDEAPKFVKIDYRMESPEDSLAELIEKLDEVENVYFDLTGGGRDASVLMVIAAQFLEMRDERTSIQDIVYSNYQAKCIYSQSDTFELERLKVAISAFTRYGKADALDRFFEGKDVTDATKRLCNSMVDFADKMALCQIDDVTQTVRDVRDALDAHPLSKGVLQAEKEDGASFSKSELMLGSLLPTIRKLFISASDDENEMIFNTIEWCVNHQMLQQALCVFTEHIPRCFLRAGLFKEQKGDNNSKVNAEFRAKYFEANLLKAIDWKSGVLRDDFKCGKKKDIPIAPYYAIANHKVDPETKELIRRYGNVNDMRNTVMYSSKINSLVMTNTQLSNEVLAVADRVKAACEKNEQQWIGYWENPGAQPAVQAGGLTSITSFEDLKPHLDDYHREVKDRHFDFNEEFLPWLKEKGFTVSKATLELPKGKKVVSELCINYPDEIAQEPENKSCIYFLR